MRHLSAPIGTYWRLLSLLIFNRLCCVILCIILVMQLQFLGYQTLTNKQTNKPQPITWRNNRYTSTSNVFLAAECATGDLNNWIVVFGWRHQHDAQRRSLVQHGRDVSPLLRHNLPSSGELHFVWIQKPHSCNFFVYDEWVLVLSRRNRTQQNTDRTRPNSKHQTANTKHHHKIKITKGPSYTFRPLNIRPLRRLDTSGSKHPVTWRHIPEQSRTPI